MATITDKLNINLNSASLSSIRNGDAHTIQNSNLIIDSDNRWGYNGSVFGSITIDPEVGGSILIDATKTWEVPFSASSGFVPKLTAIENSVPAVGLTSNAYGEVLGVWNTDSLTPLSAFTENSIALPLSGFIKLRSKTGNFISGEQIRLSNNSTVTASSSGKRSWLNVVGRGTSTLNANTRLASLCAIGDWYYLDNTNGEYNQSFKIPVQDELNGIWIERYPNSEIYDQWINVNILWDKDTTYGTSLVSDGSSIIGTLSSNGRFFYSDINTSTITIATSSGDMKYGYLPPANCKVRIPNLFLSNSGTGTGTPALSSATGPYSVNINPYNPSNKFYIGSSTYFYTIQNANVNWRIGTITSTFGDYLIKDCALVDAYLQYTGVQNLEIYNCIVSPVSGGSPTLGQSLNSRVFARNCNNVTIDGLSILAAYTSTIYVNSLRIPCAGLVVEDCESFNIKNCTIFQPIKTRTVGMAFYRNVFPSSVENITRIGTSGDRFEGVKNTTIKNVYYSNRLNGSVKFTSTSIGLFFNNCFNIKLDGCYLVPSLYNLPDGSFPAKISPNYAFQIENLSDTFDIRNIGTPTEPFIDDQTTNVGNYGSIYLADTYNISFRRGYFNSNKIVYNAGQLSKNILFENLRNTKISNNFDNPIQRNCTVRGCLMRTLSSSAQVDYMGTHWRDYFTNSTNGNIQLIGNPPTPETRYLITENLNPTGSKSGFAGLSKVAFSNAGDNITWEMPYYAIGHTGFQNINPVFVGSSTSNLSADFQYDITKDGYNGNWLSLTTQNLTGIQIDPNIGIRMKIKVTGKVNSNSTFFTALFVYTKTDADSQLLQYPLPKLQNGIISNLEGGSRVQIFNETTNTEIYNEIYPSSGTLTYPYDNGEEISEGDVIRVRVTKVSGITAKLRQELTTIATSIGFAVFVEQEEDSVYNLNAIDGSLVTEFSADYPTIQVDISDPDQTTTIPRLYAWWVANEYTEQGIRNYFEGIIAEDVANYKILTDVVDLKLDNTRNVGVVFEGDYRLYRDDGDIPIVTTTSGGGSVIMYAGRVNITRVETGVSGLTEQESNTLLKINTIPQDTFSLKLSSITEDETIGMRLKNASTVSNVGQIITDALSI